MNKNPVTKEEMLISIHHIGGIGGLGPVEALNRLNGDVHWTVYDASQEALSKAFVQNYHHVKLVNKCIGGTHSNAEFFITKTNSASSMLKSEPTASNYTFFSGNSKLIWGEQTQIVRSEKIDVYPLDSLVKAQECRAIDFLSVDAQGAEMAIFKGAAHSLKQSILGIICEFEFAYGFCQRLLGEHFR